MTRLAVLTDLVRREEKRILEAAGERGVDVLMLDIGATVFDPETFRPHFDVALERSISTVRGKYAVAFLESLGVPVVNASRTARICEDKFLTSLALRANGVPSPGFAMVFTVEQARRAVDDLGGFPVVVKPALGSWGRLLARINDQDALEAVLEHKDVLGTPPQKAIYMQEYVRKPGRDIRAFIAGGEAVCAVYRESSHWITNTARGGRVSNCPLTGELRKTCRRTADAVGGGLLAVDLFETPGGLSVNEVNHTMEFKNSEDPTGIDIAGAVVDYCLRAAAA